MAKSVKGVPDGYHTVTPYLTVTGVPKLIEFLQQAFGATDVERHERPDGSIQHAQVKIGDSPVMMGEAQGEWKPMPSMLYLYLEDVDDAYRRSLQAGGTSLREPTDQTYGDRVAGVRDPSGNQWWIATHIADVSKEEKQRSSQEQH